MDPYTEQQEPPRRRSGGCFWGCIGTLIAVAVIVVAVFGYGAWYFYQGFSNDPNIQTIVTALRSDTQAEAVLGKNIKVLSLSLHTYERSTGRGGTATYVLRVTGSNGEGEVKADLDITGDPPKITLMILTGKDGQAHYLVGTPPPNPMMQNSI
jgi:hypothetical protein